jgi:DNA-directed RNA polymerase specialized sigma24 family protein
VEDDAGLIERFGYDPSGAFTELLNRYTPELIRMIRRHVRDTDDVMEVYTTICERLRANDYQSLRRFKTDGALLPWLSVVAANASRDLFRKKRAASMPKSVLTKLDQKEQFIFRYHYHERMPHEDIAEVVSGKHGLPCTALEVVRAIGKINELLSIKKRWLLLCALNANRPALSIDELGETGYHPTAPDDGAGIEDALRERDRIQNLTVALKSLSSDDQLMVMLRFEQGMSAIQIADIMRLESHKYVYTRLRTIMFKLRKLIGGDAD